MPRFFDKEVLSDDQIAEACKCDNGGVSNEYLYNDYRNRMPFHYIEDGRSDGYYYWTYGATMELSIRLSDALAVGDDASCGCDMVIDSELSETSKNPVQNKVVTAALEGKLDKKSNKTIYDQAYVKDSEGNDKLVNISTDPSSSGIPSYDLHGHLYSNEAETPAQVVNKGQLDGAISDLPTTKDLHLLEAKLNENVIKNPDYTYIVVDATSLDFSLLAGTVEVDWGDGTTGSQVNGGSAINIDHTYTDGVKYHLVTIKKLEDAQGAWAYVIDTSGIEAYIGTKTENFFNSGAGDPDHYSNLKKVVYAEGRTVVSLPGMVKEPVVIPKSCTTLAMMDISAYPSNTIPKIVIQNNKLLTQTDFSYFDYIAKIVVPKEYINAYKTATGWSTYADKIVYEVDSSDIPTFGEGLVEENKEVKIDNTKVPIFDAGMGGALLENPSMVDIYEYNDNNKVVLKQFNPISTRDNAAYDLNPAMVFAGDSIEVYQTVNITSGSLWVNVEAGFTDFTHINKLGNENIYYDSETGTFNFKNGKFLYVPKDKEGTLAIAEEVNIQIEEFRDWVGKNLDTKLNTSGGIITGDLVINGDLTVKGTEILENIENLNVKNPMIYANADKATLLDNGGLGINVNSTDTYGIVYNPTTNSVELGLGKADANGKFTFNANEGNPVAIRSNDNKLTDKHLIAWNSTDRKLVDSGKTVDDFVDLVNPQTIEGLKTFKDETQFSSNVTHSGDVVITNKVLKILSTVGDLATQYNADKIVIDNGTGSTAVTYTLTLPKDTGTLALNKFKYSEFKSSNDGDAWVLNDSTKNVEIHYKDENSYSSLAIEKDFIEIFDINGTGTAKISMASNVITVDSESTEGKHKIIQMSPDMIKVGNTSDDTLVQIDSTSTKFNNRPQVKFNGNYVDVAIKDDLDNYVPIQSEANGYYSQVSNENGQFSVRVFQNGDEDLQNLIVNKDGVTVLGKKLATIDDLPDMTKVVTTDKVNTFDVNAGVKFSRTSAPPEPYVTPIYIYLDSDLYNANAAIEINAERTQPYKTEFGINFIKFARFGNSTTLRYSADSNITNNYILEIPAANGTLALQADVDEKVDKLSSSLVNQAYVRNGNGEDTGLAYTYTAEGNTLALRNATGQLQVGDPLTGNDAVNKLSMEKAIKATRIAHISNSLLGG